MAASPTTQSQFSGGPLEAIVTWELGFLPGALRWVSAGLGIATALSAVFFGGLAMRSNEVMIALLEALAIGAGVFATMTALGRFREGAGLSLAGCALAIAGAAVLCEPTLITQYFGTRGEPVVLSGFAIKWVMLGRIGAGALLAIHAAVTVWARNPRRSAWYLVRAALTAVPVVLILGAISLPAVQHRVGALPKGWGDIVRIGGVIVGFFVCLTLLATSGHCAIRSLEVGRLDDEGRPSGDGTEPGRAAA